MQLSPPSPTGETSKELACFLWSDDKTKYSYISKEALVLGVLKLLVVI